MSKGFSGHRCNKQNVRTFFFPYFFLFSRTCEKTKVVQLHIARRLDTNTFVFN